MTDQIRQAFIKSGWFGSPGAYLLVDGGFGSSGKGNIAALIGAALGDQIDIITTNAGSNSGHVGYTPGGPKEGLDKIVTRQIPVASVVIQALGLNPKLTTYLNAGAIIDPSVLEEESVRYGLVPFVHPCAATIEEQDRQAEQSGAMAKIASTAKGVGAALARKVLRDPSAVWGVGHSELAPWNWSKDRVFVETAQGFSLGLNEPRFYPYVTSRECTVMQAISDARIPAQMVKKVIMTSRTFPIRVGSTPDGHSGDCYPDQKEMQWTDLGVEPELTTVTKRIRRVFSWSRIQFREACAANRPDVLAVMFMDYLKPAGVSQGRFMNDLINDYAAVMNKSPDFILTGWGPRPEDVRVL